MYRPMRVLLLVVALVVLLSPQGSAAGPQPWQNKVDPWVLETVAQGETEFLVFLTAQADLSRARQLPTKLEKGRYVYETLTAVAEATQGPVRRALDRLGVEYRPYWVANMIWVRGDRAVVEAMAKRSDVAHVFANPRVRADLPLPSSDPSAPESEQAAAPQVVEWNIAKVRAPDVWAAGYTGQGAVVAGQDTGYQWDHPALKGKYRGWNGATASHDYNWHDAIHASTGACGANSPVPCDDHDHGTHTMGTIVGDDGAGNQIGMAPGAKWIGCRNMDAGYGTPATYSECYQWFIAPTRVDGSDPRPDLAPHVINNSWSCPPSEGCTNPLVLLTVVQNVRAAGIVTVHSAGNSGAACATVNTPAAIYDESFTVGATNSSDNIASFSSRGPVTVDGSGRRKPDVSAPGVNIRSSVRGGGYAGGWSGTSMAGPHVAGQVALLISAYPWLAGDVDQIEDIIADSAVPRTTSQSCGGDTPGSVPNNVYGWGRIDAYQAYAIGCRAPTAAPTAAISRVSATAVQVAWNAVPSAATYQVWWADNAPYFTPGGSCVGNCAVVSGTTFSQAILGSAASNRTYVVRAANPCGSAAAHSNRVAEFEFELTPGAP
ncbi:MAG: S8 family serine peptidase [Caldilineales bacterium]|nr:S8 family serine peptidase [Caldilineales bacterium]MDW8317176.1 S8 family serine peptidase [Anaerolineae bacterium]